MNYTYADYTVTEFTEALASKSSVPGGGGASALVGAIGIALGDMVGEFTVGKKTYAEVEDDVKALMVRAQQLRTALLSCIDKDAAAFEPLSKAYAIPKDAPNRDTIMEECLKAAAAVPFEILELCAETIKLQKAFAEKGSRMMTSDAATGVAICRAALQGAAINIKINTSSMKNRPYADAVNTKTDELLNIYTAMADDVFQSVYSKY